MNTVVFVYFLVVGTYRGYTVIPTPYSTEASCKASAAAVRRPQSEGGAGEPAFCVKAEKEIK